VFFSNHLPLGRIYFGHILFILFSRTAYEVVSQLSSDEL
jgi:hypothetical protein